MSGANGRDRQGVKQGARHGADDGGQQAQHRWLETPANAAEAALRQALDQAAARAADEVALRRVWARVADLPEQAPTAMAADAVLDAADAEQMALGVARGRRARWSWLVAASLAGATAALALMLVQTRSQVQGQARVVEQATRENATKENGANARVGVAAATTEQGSSVVAPATVRTGVGEKLRLTLRGGTDVVVLSDSALVLDDKDRPSVSTGEVQFHVPRQAPGHTFAVTARDYRVVVIGTRFSVRVDRERTAVGVTEGVVEIWTDHRIARVAAGESWSAAVAPGRADTKTDTNTTDTNTTGTTAAAPAASAANEGGANTDRKTRGLGARGMRAARSSGSSPSSKEPRAVLALATPSRPTGASTAPAGGGAGPLVTAAPSNQSPSGSNSGGNNNNVAPANDSRASSAPAPAVAPAPVETPLALQARAARTGGDSRRALGLYRTLAQRGGAAGENAEYEIGRILRDGLDQPREALAAWRSYRTTHPRGLLRIETDISVIETLVSLGDKSGALTEAAEFVRRYPESERRMEIARLAGDLLRERGDCAGAVDAYDTALSGRVRRGMADGVTFHRAACVQRNDRGAGTVALQAYLRAFPSGGFRADAQKLLSQTP